MFKHLYTHVWNMFLNSFLTCVENSRMIHIWFMYTWVIQTFDHNICEPYVADINWLKLYIYMNRKFHLQFSSCIKNLQFLFKVIPQNYFFSNNIKVFELNPSLFDCRKNFLLFTNFMPHVSVSLYIRYLSIFA